MNVYLNFINNSDDSNNPGIVIFQKNVAPDADECAVAWIVIENCGRGDSRHFNFPLTMTVAVSDRWGIYTPHLDARHGQLFQLTLSGDQLEQAGASGSPEEVQVLNSLPKGAINANIYKDSRLLAVRQSIEPQQKAVFAFTPSIWIGVAPQVTQGQIMTPAIVSTITTELSLEGIASADIVMTGGGPGAGSRPFVFTLENIVMCQAGI